MRTDDPRERETEGELANNIMGIKYACACNRRARTNEDVLLRVTRRKKYNMLSDDDDDDDDEISIYFIFQD